MKRSLAPLPMVALLALAACGGGGQSQAENTAEALEEAAEQSDPAAAQVLENAADAAREGNGNAQQALQKAGNAQAATAAGAPVNAGAAEPYGPADAAAEAAD